MPRTQSRAGWIYALIFLSALLVYLPVLNGGFIWDDSGHVTRPDLRSLSGLFRIWFEIGATQQYYPVLHSAFWIEHGIWGDAAVGYHLLNVLLHATAACLFGTLLCRLKVPGCWIAAFLFLLHPVSVESVAWISEQKNTLSLIFYLAGALVYLNWDECRSVGLPLVGNLKDRSPTSGDPAISAYWIASLLFLLALLTKTVTATLPAALLVISWWRRGRIEWRRDVQPLVPWFAVGVAVGLFTAHLERELIGAQGVDFSLSLWDRFVLSGRVFCFYLGKLIWPADQSFIYPHWQVDASVPWQWIYPLVALMLIAVLAWKFRRGPLAAILLFGGSLFPVLGFFNVYPFLYSYVADHFQYLPSLGLFALAGAGLASLGNKRVSLGIGVALSVTLGCLSLVQARNYRDGFTLYEATLRVNPTCWMAHNNLAMALTEAGRIDEAVPHLEAALALRPDFPEALSNLGDDLTRLGRAAQAIPDLERALQLQPSYAEAHNNLGSALMAVGRDAEGTTHFEAALKINPNYARAHNNLGLALATAGKNAEAIDHFSRAAALDPGDSEPETNWAIALTLQDKFSEAVPHFEKAIAISPGSANAHGMYGRALQRNGRMSEAAQQLQEAQRLDARK